MHKRVVVTGIGVVSSIGIGKDIFWNALIKGLSGISIISLFDTSKSKHNYAGEIKEFYPYNFISHKLLKSLGRASQFAIVAAKFALADAKVALSHFQRRSTAVIIGTTVTEESVLDFSCEMLLKGRWDKITSNILLNIFSPSISRNVGYFLKIKGLNNLIPNACASGNFAIGYAFDLIKKGERDLAIVGGAEALSQLAFCGFRRLHAMAPEVCAPFDKNRKGMLLGEGAGILVLEPLDKAKKRGAPIYAEVLGYGLSCDAYRMTIPKKEGIKKAMEKALRNSNVTKKEIDYISAHGTGTIQNDRTEAQAIKELFGQRYRRVAVSSIKSMLGHCMGAASSLEAAACCLALRDGIIPPTINFKTPDPECDIDCVPNRALKKDLRVVLNNSFAFGGNNCCVAFGRVS